MLNIRMQKLSDEALLTLEWQLADGYRYMVLKEDKERVLRMKYPSVSQQRFARIEQHKFLSEISKVKGLKTRRQVERENKSELDLIKKELRQYEDARLKAERQFFKFQAENLPKEEDEDDEELLFKMREVSMEMAEVQELINETISRQLEILEMCVQELATQHLLERMAQVSWEYNTGEEDDDGEVWLPLWKDWEEFENDNDQIVQLLLGETRTWVMGGTPFFAQQPSPPAGVSDT